MKNTIFAIEKIRIDGGTQSRAVIDPKTVEEYRAAIEDGAVFPAIIVFFDGTEYWLADGFHRLQAKQKLEALEIECDIRQGTRRDAILYSVGANAAHGLRRTNADKRRAVLCLLEDEEWAQRSDRWIAEQCGVTDKTVAAIREETTAEFPQSTTRTGQDGRTINTTNIGKPPPSDNVAPILAQTTQRAYPTPEPHSGSTRANPTTPEEAKALLKNFEGISTALGFFDKYSPDYLKQVCSSDDGKELGLKQMAFGVRGALIELKTALDAALE